MVVSYNLSDNTSQQSLLKVYLRLDESRDGVDQIWESERGPSLDEHHERGDGRETSQES